jgi:hypothetical protein
METVVLFYDHLEYFTVFGYIFWTFGIVCGHLVYFSPLWYLYQKNLATLDTMHYYYNHPNLIIWTSRASYVLLPRDYIPSFF